jgi:hypothetical protein
LWAIKAGNMDVLLNNTRDRKDLIVSVMRVTSVAENHTSEILNEK